MTKNDNSITNQLNYASVYLPKGWLCLPKGTLFDFLFRYICITKKEKHVKEIHADDRAEL